MDEPDEYLDHPVRQYVITAGRAHPTRNMIRPETLLLANPDMRLPISASRQQRALLDIFRGMLSLAEAAAHLQLPVSLVVVLVSDLVDSGHLWIRSGPPHHVLPERGLLEKVLHGLQKL